MLKFPVVSTLMPLNLLFHYWYFYDCMVASHWIMNLKYQGSPYQLPSIIYTTFGAVPSPVLIYHPISEFSCTTQLHSPCMHLIIPCMLHTYIYVTSMEQQLFCYKKQGTDGIERSFSLLVTSQIERFYLPYFESKRIFLTAYYQASWPVSFVRTGPLDLWLGGGGGFRLPALNIIIWPCRMKKTAIVTACNVHMSNSF